MKKLFFSLQSKYIFSEGNVPPSHSGNLCDNIVFDYYYDYYEKDDWYKFGDKAYWGQSEDIDLGYAYDMP